MKLVFVEVKWMLQEEATVTNEGGILLAKNVVCDGDALSRQVRVITFSHLIKKKLGVDCKVVPQDE